MSYNVHSALQRRNIYDPSAIVFLPKSLLKNKGKKFDVISNLKHIKYED